MIHQRSIILDWVTQKDFRTVAEFINLLIATGTATFEACIDKDKGTCTIAFTGGH